MFAQNRPHDPQNQATPSPKLNKEFVTLPDAALLAAAEKILTADNVTYKGGRNNTLIVTALPDDTRAKLQGLGAKFYPDSQMSPFPGPGMMPGFGPSPFDPK